MAIDYSKFLKTATKPGAKIAPSGIDYSKFGYTGTQKKTEEVPTGGPEIKYLPGGGAYWADKSKPGELVTTPREVSGQTKTDIRGGSFADTNEEVDHIISKALGGADVPENLQTLKDTKDLSQTVVDWITGRKDLPSNYKPKNRQEGKMVVEWKAIEDYNAGRISLGQARVQVMAAQHLINLEKEGYSTSTAKNYLPELGKNIVKTGKGIFNFLTSSTQEFGKILGAAAATYDPMIKAMRQQTLDQAQQSYDRLMQLANNTQDKEKKFNFLKLAQVAADTAGLDIYSEPEFQKTTKQIIGAAAGTSLELLSFGTYGAAAKVMQTGKLAKALPTALKSAAKIAEKKTLGQMTKQAGKEAVKVGAPLGGAFGASGAMQQDKDLKGILQDTLMGGAIGTVFQFGLSLGLQSLMQKSSQIGSLFGKKSIEIKPGIPPGGTPPPGSDIKVNTNDPTVKYSVKKLLGIDGNGNKVLARTEINSKTGEVTIYYDKNLDKGKNLLLKADVLNHEHGHIIDKRIGGGTNISAQLPNYEGNKTVLDKLLGDFAIKENKTTKKISADLTAELDLVATGTNKAEQFANAVKEYSKDPNAFAKKAPTLDKLLAFKPDMATDVHVTTRQSMLKETLEKPVKTQEQTLFDELIPKVDPQEAPGAKKTAPGSTQEPKMTKASLLSSTGMKTGKTVKTKSFNPKTINAPEETRQLFESLGGTEVNKQRISKGNEDIRDLAKMVGLTEDELIKAKPGSIANAETVTKARQLVLDKAQDLMNYLKSFNANTASQEELQVLKDKWVKLVSMQKSVAGLRTEASNVFRSLGLELMPGENATLAELGNLLQKAGVASQGDASLFAKKVMKELTLTTKQKIGQGFLSTWYASILSGPKTTTRNIVSTMANILTELSSKAANPKQWKEIPASVSALFKGFVEGLPEAKAVLKGEKGALNKFTETITGATKPEVFTGKFKTFGKVVESVGRFLSAQDVLMKSAAKSMEKASLKAQGYEIEDGLLNAITDAYGESSVYHGIPKGRFIRGLRNAVQALRREAPESKIIIPFVDTVANVMDRQFDYIPVFSAIRLSKGNLEKQALQIIKDYGLKEADKAFIVKRLRDQQLGRMILGTAVSIGAFTAAKNGVISGSGPTNVSERQQLQDTGWRPNSIKIGDYWVPYVNWGPLAGILSMAGNVHDKTVYDKTPTKTLSDLIGKGIVGWMQTQTNMSFLSGVSDAFDLIAGGLDPKKYINQLVSGLLTTTIPAAYSQTKDMFARDKFIADTLADKIRLKLGITEGLEPQLTALGKQQKADLISGITPSAETKDPVLKFLTEHELTITKPNKNQVYTVKRGIKTQMTPEEYTRYITESGQAIYDELQKSLTRLGKLKEDKRKKEVDAIVREARTKVKNKILHLS